MRFIAMLILGVFLVACGRGGAVPERKDGNANDEQYRKEMDEVRKAVKAEVKVKLRKDPKGYNWEIQGKDPQEVLKANEILRKKLAE